MEEDLAKRVHLRPAGPADLERLRRWDEQPHVVASDPNDDWGWETELHEVPDAHNYTGWRDAFDPYLVDLLRRVWAADQSGL